MKFEEQQSDSALLAAPHEIDASTSITFIVTSEQTRENFPFSLSSNDSLYDLHEAVARYARVEWGTFELACRDSEAIVESDRDRMLTTLPGFRGSKCRLQMRGIYGRDPVPTPGPIVPIGRSLTQGLAARQTENFDSANRCLTTEPGSGHSSPLASPTTFGASSYSAYSGSSSYYDNVPGYVGLANQGATCYLSSLIQSLYMTPEFRAAIYAWRYTGAPSGADDCIALQMQRLFVNLQTSKDRSVSTRDLTTSFGWTGDDAFEQHDVQELLRVLFDALETELKGTPQGASLQQLCSGEWCDYVQCKHCLKESLRAGEFADLTLAIRSFGLSPIHYQSLDAALGAFLEPE